MSDSSTSQTSPCTNPSSSVPEGKKRFFRQSSWMIFATTMSGLLMWAVHKVATGALSGNEYGLLAMFLRILNLVTIPACGFQAVFAQQTAVALDADSQTNLSALVRGTTRWIILLWGICAIGILLFHAPILELFKLRFPFLVLVVCIGLVVLLRPIGVGLLQGKQDFLWVGLSQIADGIIRLSSIAFIVICLHRQATGALVGVLLGILVCMGICAWKTTSIWQVPARKINMWQWARKLIPLTLGAGIPLFMMGADALVVQAVFPEDKVNLYAAAGIVTQALVLFTLPIAAVMFPKIARSAAVSEKTPVLLLALGTTGVLAGCVVVGTFLMPTLPIRIMFTPAYLPAAELLPWFALAMSPLTLSTVLINDLLARAWYRSVPWLWSVAIAYFAALCIWHISFFQIISLVGIFNILLLGVALLFRFTKFSH